jgi:FkbM family methyltransferase
VKCADGIWFPANEKHLVEMLKGSPRVDGKGTYQFHKLSAAMRYVKHRRCAIDIGMHVGLWAMHLVKEFKKVVGFEPVADHIKCLLMNMKGRTNYIVHACALGERTAQVGLGFLAGSTGSTYIALKGHGIEMHRLDEFEFEAIDFIKIDVEGYEYFVVQGGEQTIRKHKPVIIIEQKPGKVEWYGNKQYDARNLLQSWGARQKFELHGDCCLSWR